MTAKTFRSKIVEIQGIKWTGYNLREILDFVGKDTPITCRGNFEEIDIDSEEEPIRKEVTDMELSVWNYLEKQFINVPTNHWVLRGLKNEYYPCEQGALDLKYEEV